jgi:hypothetical protein
MARQSLAKSTILTGRGFVTKLLQEIAAGNVTAAILLAHNNTDAVWFHEAAGVAAAICFTRGRIRFEQEDGPAESPPQGQCFLYYGKDVAGFRKVFTSVGLVLPALGPLGDSLDDFQ